MILRDTVGNLTAQLNEIFPRAQAATEASQAISAGLRHYQALALFGLAARFNRSDANILELGTAVGYSASMIAQAAPLAHLVTLNPRQIEIELATKNLRRWPNAKVIMMCSWDYLANYAGPALDMVFVDGAHNQIARDLPWFNHVMAGGLFLCHDYTPEGGKKPSPIIYAELNKMAAQLGRPFDVSVIDTDSRLEGIAGFYRREGETWPVQSLTQ